MILNMAIISTLALNAIKLIEAITLFSVFFNVRYHTTMYFAENGEVVDNYNTLLS